MLREPMKITNSDYEIIDEAIKDVKNSGTMIRKTFAPYNENGEYDIETFFERALFASRQLAKRQTTWIRGWKDFTETRIGDFATLEDNLKKVISLL